LKKSENIFGLFKKIREIRKIAAAIIRVKTVAVQEFFVQTSFANYREIGVKVLLFLAKDSENIKNVLLGRLPCSPAWHSTSRLKEVCSS
jgi:hypothetical protein